MFDRRGHIRNLSNMISKERNADEHSDEDKFSKAGAKAEEQMAFYLRRVFVDSDDIRVFNDLRLTDDSGDAAQMDHLILHRYGFIVVESKSVSSELLVNQQREFSRLWNKRWEGMRSPIQQAKAQMDLLRRILNQNAKNLLTKMLGLVQARFGNCPMEVIVAISDHGQIDRPRNVDIPELVKADQVVDRVREIYKR
ncbi:MAG: hypothetical protein CMO80_14585 [Verrucomicrobiales bacterium]|nr:hypothetical protein [Verrucomicrobiales bacterium]